MIKLIDTKEYSEISKDFLSHFNISDKLKDYNLLQSVLAAFSEIPYENVSKLNRMASYSLEDSNILRFPDKVWADFKNSSLGGTCYSLTFLLQAVLSNIGFSCYPVSADMKWGKNVHCGLMVIYNNQSYWCDPGYLLTQPLLMDGTHRRFYRTESRGVCLDYNDENYNLSTFFENQFKWRYKFKAISCTTEDFFNYWLASFQMPSMNGICLSKQNNQSMIYVHNNYFREVSNSGVKKKRAGNKWTHDIERLFGISESFLIDAYEISRMGKE